MQHVIVVDVHQNGGRLADDQRHPHGCVPIVSSQESANEIGEWDLKQEVECEMRNGSILFDVHNETLFSSGLKGASVTVWDIYRCWSYN